MSEEEFCSNCAQRKRCSDVYQALGRAEGPDVGLRSVTAFLLPIIVFIISLALFENFFAGFFSGDKLLTAVSLVFSLAVSFIFVLAVKAFWTLYGKNKNSCAFKGDQRSQRM